jgi:hypothetical protein
VRAEDGRADYGSVSLTELSLLLEAVLAEGQAQG